MLSQITLLLVGLALANAQFYGQAPAPVNPYQNAIVNSINQDTVGNFGYATADGQSRQQVVAPDGSVRGRYSYIDANGKPVTVNYVADQFGYRAAGDNVPAHAQHVPPPQPATQKVHNTGHYVHQPGPSYQAPQPTFPAPAPAAFPSFPPPAAAPLPIATQYGQPAATQYGQPAPNPLHRNPAAEQQLVNTITAHHHSDQRAQAAQLQQLDAITRQNPAFAAAQHHYPYGRR